MTRSLACGDDEFACDEKSPLFRDVTHGNHRFYAVSQLLDATLTLLTATGAIAVDLWDQSRSGQETSKPLPHLGSACCPPKVARNHKDVLSVLKRLKILVDQYFLNIFMLNWKNDARLIIYIKFANFKII